MSVRIAWWALLLPSCALYVGEPATGDDDRPPVLRCLDPRPGCPDWDTCAAGDCVDLPTYECDAATGEWVVSDPICDEPYAFFDGDLHLEVAFAEAQAACDGLTPRNPVDLSVSVLGVVSAAAPVSILESDVGAGGIGEPAWLRVVTRDDWAGTAVTIGYDLQIDGYIPPEVSGIARLSTPGCTASLWVTGTQCMPGAVPCTVYDDGWNLRCQLGRVREDDLTRVGYCRPGETTEVCETGSRPSWSVVATCPGDCADTTVHWFETLEERDAFDPRSLCSDDP